jgi:hypothetical protein
LEDSDVLVSLSTTVSSADARSSFADVAPNHAVEILSSAIIQKIVPWLAEENIASLSRHGQRV